MIAQVPGHSIRNFIKYWLFSTDPTQIGKLYFFGVTAFGLIGSALAVALQSAHLTTSRNMTNPALYGRLFSAHGMVMVFMFAGPSLAATLGNLVLPKMIGATRVAYRRLNLFGWWLYLIGSLVTCVSLAIGSYDAGWTGVLPASTIELLPTSLLDVGLALLTLSLLLVSINTIATVHRCRAKRTSIFGLPVLVWNLYLTAIVMLVAMTERLGLLVLVVAGQFFQMTMLKDALLLQHLTWFSASALGYAAILPVIGVISEVIPTFSGSKLFASDGVRYSCLVIAALSLVVWGQHLYVSGQSDLTSVLSSFYSLLLVIPSIFILGSWLTTLYRGHVSLQAPILYALAALLLFLVGGLSGGILSILAINVQLHGSAFVVGHLHFAMLGAVVGGFLAALHYWWPMQFGRIYSGRWSLLGPGMFFVGTCLIGFPFLSLGLQGTGRRTLDNGSLHPTQFWISVAGSILVIGCLIITIATLMRSKSHSTTCANPWGATGPEFNPEYQWPQPDAMQSGYIARD